MLELSFNDILENTELLGIIDIDEKGVVIGHNKLAIKFLGMHCNSIKCFKLSDILTDCGDMLKSQKRVLEKRIINDRTLICEYFPKLANKKFLGAILLIKDDTDREELLKKLKSTEVLLTSIDAVLESSYDGMYITNGEAVTLRINKAYERITGIHREKMLGRSMKSLVEEGLLSKSASLVVLETGKVTTMQQEFMTGKKALVTSTPVFDEKGKINMIVTNVRDITELDKLKEELEKKEMLAQKYYSEIEGLRMSLLDTDDMVSEDRAMLQVLYLAKRIAAVDTTVLLLGETGVGKEEVAKYIHKNSTRNKKQFIKINCGAIPENLIESELFGYEKGSFTGASKEGKAGLFEVASGGTLFLDEVGELPLNMQVKLLRVLQESEVTRIGGVKPIKVNVRIIAATNRNLEEMIRENQFREDLYYRLNVVPINIPPLRERRGDIIPLIKFFLLGLNKKYGFNKYFNSEALEALYKYNWLGNVRELKNVIERVIILTGTNGITKEDLPQKIRNFKESNMEKSKVKESDDKIVNLKNAVAELEISLIEKAFDKYGNVRDAAKALGIDPATFVRKRKKYKS